MKKKTWVLRIVACLLFTVLPMVFCTALLALAATGSGQGTPQLRLVASVRNGQTPNGEAALQYTVELANEGDGPWLEGCIAHEGLAGGEPEGVEIIGGGEYKALSTGRRGLWLTGVRLLPGEVLRVSYGIRATIAGERERITAQGSTPAGIPSEASVELQAAQQKTHTW